MYRSHVEHHVESTKKSKSPSPFFSQSFRIHTITNRQEKNHREQKLKQEARDFHKQKEIEEKEEERREKERRRTKKTYKRLKKVSTDKEKEKKNVDRKVKSRNNRRSATQERSMKRSSNKDSDVVKTVTTTSTTAKRSSRRSKKKEEEETIFRTALSDKETVDVSIIEKDAAIQLPLAKHAHEWESMTEDEHPEGVNTDKCENLKAYFDTGKFLVMQLPLDLPNSVEDISSDVRSNMPEGYFGDIRIHESGKVTIKTSKGIVFNVTEGIVDRMAEEALEIDTETKRLTMLPRIAGRLIVHPDYDSLMKDSSRKKE